MKCRYAGSSMFKLLQIKKEFKILRYVMNTQRSYQS